MKTPLQELITQMSYNRGRALGAEKDAYNICILYVENMLEKLETLKTNNKMKTYKHKFRKSENIFELLPSITYYKGRGGYFNKGTLTFSWLKWAFVIDMNWIIERLNTKER